MGLDISVLGNLQRLRDRGSDYGPGEDAIYVNNDFPGRADDITDGIYKCDQLKSFRAGSYSGYNQWRATLSRTMLGVEPATIWANYDLWEGKPFVELICFSDCEGTIGPKTSAKLAADFIANINKLPGEQEWFVRLYREWMNAFHLAASTNGCVCFH